MLLRNLLNRPTATSLLEHPFITTHAHKKCQHPPNSDLSTAVTLYPLLPSPFSSVFRCAALPTQADFQRQQQQQQQQQQAAARTTQVSSATTGGGGASDLEPHPPDDLSDRPLREVYYLWSLAGGDIEPEMRTAGLIFSKQAIFTLPRCLPRGGGNWLPEA